ncbi:MAG: hypothetical protein BJ554DRAFT_1270, partial [Olpidium bornovanus]
HPETAATVARCVLRRPVASASPARRLSLPTWEGSFFTLPAAPSGKGKPQTGAFPPRGARYGSPCVDFLAAGFPGPGVGRRRLHLLHRDGTQRTEEERHEGAGRPRALWRTKRLRKRSNPNCPARRRFLGTARCWTFPAAGALSFGKGFSPDTRPRYLPRRQPRTAARAAKPFAVREVRKLLPASREDDGVLLGDWDEDVESWDDLGTENSDRDLHRAAQSLAASPSTKIKTPGAAAVADVSPAGSVLSPIRRAVADPLPPLPAHTLEEHEELLPSPFLADNVDAQELKDAMKALEQRREAEARGSGDGDCGAPEPQDDANADAGDPPPATMGGDVDDNLARMFHECVNISADGRMAESRSC